MSQSVDETAVDGFLNGLKCPVKVVFNDLYQVYQDALSKYLESVRAAAEAAGLDKDAIQAVLQQARNTYGNYSIEDFTIAFTYNQIKNGVKNCKTRDEIKAALDNIYSTISFIVPPTQCNLEFRQDFGGGWFIADGKSFINDGGHEYTITVALSGQYTIQQLSRS